MKRTIKVLVTIVLVIFLSFSVFLGIKTWLDNKNAPVSFDMPVRSEKKVSQFTSVNVATHASELDCWLIINNKIYDVTKYLSLHPGGKMMIMPYCGKDATVAFTTQGGRGKHNADAVKILESYYLHDLEN